jgi:diguanylate cyclase (GGDEF)-like protein
MLDQLTQESLILIIDDNVEMIRLLSSILTGQAEIMFATNGKAGLRLACEHRPTLILLDVQMPGMDGYEVCQKLKNNVDTRDCAIIFVTAQTSRESEVAALNAGAVDFITKPLNPAVVCARVQTHLNLRLHSIALLKLANKDGLTGLFNRRYFNEQLDLEYARHKRQKLPLGIALIDIDHFKQYNDHFGHVEGDSCLIKIAKSIESSTRRPSECVARFGGEEFVVILPYTSTLEITKYGEILCQHVRSLNLPSSPCGKFDRVTVSVGVFSTVPDAHISELNFVLNADKALYQAKSDGRNCSRVTLISAPTIT